MRRNFGCGVYHLVFDPSDESLVGQIKYYAREAIERFEKRIILISVDIDTKERDRGVLYIKVFYQLLKTRRVGQMTYPFYVQDPLRRSDALY